MTDTNRICPCGSGAGFATCCDPVIKGERDSQTAEELMRARYTAFATGAIDFIVASTHSRTKSEIDVPFIRDWSLNSDWRGLQILEVKSVNENKAFVSLDRKSTRLNSSHLGISYAVFCLEK